jgi:hypothetical protein
LGVGDRQRPEEQGVEEPEHRRGDADAGGEREDGKQRVAGVTGQQPNRTGDVVHHPSDAVPENRRIRG